VVGLQDDIAIEGNVLEASRRLRAISRARCCELRGLKLPEDVLGGVPVSESIKAALLRPIEPGAVALR
jgi:hypothetical protein